MSKKRGIAVSELGWWLLGLIVLGVAVISIMGMRESGSGIIQYIKQTFSFGQWLAVLS